MDDRSNRKYDRLLLGKSLIIAGIVMALIFVSGFFGIYRIISDPAFPAGVRIDGLDVSGMTYGEAERAVNAASSERLSCVRIVLDLDGNTSELNAEDMGVALNEEEVLNVAYCYNRDTNDTIAQRFNKTIALSQGMDFETQLVIDERKLRETLEAYARRNKQDATDAAASFDKETREFTYVKETYGTRVDVEALQNDIIRALDEKRYGNVRVKKELVSPRVTLCELKKNTVLISEYETIAKNDPDRNTNIRLMCQAVDGLIIKPGETLSINELVGERTEEKGFKKGPAIINGTVVEDIGGGICQLSGTLYNAALIANMEIVERVRHTWPSDYLPIGQDATLNWDDKDLKIRNTSDYSIYVSATFKNQRVVVRLYGQPLPEGVTIEVENEILEEIPPDNQEIRYTNDLPVGTRRTARNAQNGYVVKVYRVFLRNGIVVNKELVSTDTYPPVNKLILLGSNNINK